MGQQVSYSGRKVGLEDFDLVRLVGKGAFGKVWQVRRKETGEIFAMKILDKKTVIEQNLVEHTVFERDVMLACNNPFIINLYYAFQTEESLYFVLDFVGGGSLFTVLRDHPLGYFTEEEGRFYAAEILLGIEELHKNNIAYRDLKLENILLGTDGHIILTDFGLSARLANRETKLHSFSGTAIYLAPEVLLGEGHDQTVDWWSYGVLVHLLLTGEPPFWSENRRELFDMIVFGETIIDDPLLSPEGRDLIIKLLNRNTKKRLGCTGGAEEIKKHKFFSGINWSHVQKRKLKPPMIPEQEFLLTSRKEPLQIPSRKDFSECDEDDEEEVSVQSDIDFFQGFSFATTKSSDRTLPQSKILQNFVYTDDKKRPQRKKKTKKRMLASSIPSLDIPGVNESADIKLQLLKEQASRDNRNRKFITVGDVAGNSDSSKDEEDAVVPVLLRAASFIDGKNGMASRKKKKKHKSSGLQGILSPRRRVVTASTTEPWKDCSQCNSVLNLSGSYSCKKCNELVCTNCVTMKIPTTKSEEILTRQQCIHCFYMNSILELRKQKPKVDK